MKSQTACDSLHKKKSRKSKSRETESRLVGAGAEKEWAVTA